MLTLDGVSGIMIIGLMGLFDHLNYLAAYSFPLLMSSHRHNCVLCLCVAHFACLLLFPFTLPTIASSTLLRSRFRVPPRSFHPQPLHCSYHVPS